MDECALLRTDAKIHKEHIHTFKNQLFDPNLVSSVNVRSFESFSDSVSCWSGGTDGKEWRWIRIHRIEKPFPSDFSIQN